MTAHERYLRELVRLGRRYGLTAEQVRTPEGSRVLLERLEQEARAAEASRPNDVGTAALAAVAQGARVLVAAVWPS